MASADLFDPALTQDPLLLQPAAGKAPIHYSMAMKVWWVTEFDSSGGVAGQTIRFGHKFPERVKKILPNLTPTRET
jgi:hypothetical protein